MNPGLVKKAVTYIFVVGAFLIGPVATAADMPRQLNVGYHQQWPAPMQFAQAKQTFDAVLGIPVNWRVFGSGQDMAAALAAGDIDIGYSLGHVPFLVAVNSGANLSMIAVAVSYPDDDNCILRSGAGIDRGNAAQLAGKSIAVRPGSVTHFRLLKVLEQVGVEAADVSVMAVADGDAAHQALRQGRAVMACGYGDSLKHMRALGQPLMSGAEQQAMGLKLFDVIAVENGFLEQNADLVQTFMDVVVAANSQWQQNPEPMLKVIASAAYMDRDSARAALREFSFPSVAEQKSEAWLGGGVAEYLRALADFFVANGQLDSTLENYQPHLRSRFLR